MSASYSYFRLLCKNTFYSFFVVKGNVFNIIKLYVSHVLEGDLNASFSITDTMFSRAVAQFSHTYQCQAI